MSVLVKDMEMPGSCYQCNMCVNVLYGEDIVVICTALEKEIIALMAERQDDCPLVEVPTPHGRLIDADALDICKREQQAWQDYEHDPDDEYLEGVKDGLHEASKQLSTAMTIIGAEI